MMGVGMRDDSQLAEQVTVLLHEYGGYRLNKEQLSNCPDVPVFAWELPINVSYKGQRVTLRLQYKSSICGSLPKVYVSKPVIRPLDLPHVESNGALCILPSNAIVDITTPHYVIELLIRAQELLHSAVSGAIDDDFKDEIISYWNYHCITFHKPAFSLCDLQRDNGLIIREVFCYPHVAGLIYADTKDELIQWLDNRNILPSSQGDEVQRKKRNRYRSHRNKIGPHSRREKALNRIRPCPLFYIDGVLMPSDYPNTVADILAMTRDEAQKDAVLQKIVTSLLNDTLRNPTALVAMRASTGNCVIGLRFERNIASPKPGDIFAKLLTNGFRESIPLKVLESRCKHMKVYGQPIIRMDSSWVYGRDHNPAAKTLAQHRVSIVGCGSIGAAVARLLLQSGITKLSLWDPECLASENCSRHTLGLNWVDKPKALALKTSLSAEFPSSMILANCCSWDESKPLCISDMRAADIVVSCTANWVTDQQLLRAQKLEDGPPIVFSMVEAHAMAGHVIINGQGSDVFNQLHYCDGENVGSLRIPATDWRGAITTHRVPACGGVFQPYGVIPLTHVQAITARAVISLIFYPERSSSKVITWLGSTSELHELGGKWSEQWVTAHGDPSAGERVVEMSVHEE